MFYTHTDANDFQIVAVIRPYGKPIAFYRRKITGMQKRYTVKEKELLGIV